MMHRLITDALGLGLGLIVFFSCSAWAYFFGGDPQQMISGVVTFIACRAYMQGFRRDPDR